MKQIPRSVWSMMVVACIIATAITVCAVICHSDVWEITPLYISVVIALLNSRVSRFGSLIGGLNSILYGIVYFHYGLYANSLYAVLVSMPLQIMTFIIWGKHAYKGTTYFKTLTSKQRFILSGGFVVCWLILYVALYSFGSDYMLLDNTATLLGIIASILMMCSYIEYTILSFFNSMITLVLYVTMIVDNPGRMPFLLYAAYSTVCCFAAWMNARKYYLAQQDQNKE